MYKKPSKAELIWRSMLKYYAAVISGICHKRTRVREATNGELGYTDNAGNVFVAKNHFFYDTIRNEIKAQTETGKKLVYMYGGSHKKKLSQLVEDIVNMYRLGIVVHEALHQLLSDFSYMVRFLDRKESEKELAYEYQKKVFLTVWNLVEDPAIEGMREQSQVQFTLSLSKRRVKVYFIVFYEVRLQVVGFLPSAPRWKAVALEASSLGHCHTRPLPLELLFH